MSYLTEEEIVSNYGHETITLDSEDIEKLLQGKELYNTDFDEYSFSIVAEEPVPLISLDKVKQAREKINKNYEGGNHADEYIDGYNDGLLECLSILDKLIESEEK